MSSDVSFRIESWGGITVNFAYSSHLGLAFSYYYIFNGPSYMRPTRGNGNSGRI